VKGECEGVATQYAEAVLDLALNPDTPDLQDIIAKDLALISEVMQNNPGFELVFEHPSVPAEEKKAFLVTHFKTHVNDLTMRLLELLNDKRRLALMPQIASKYHALLNERNHIITAKLVCSDQLSDKSLADIKARLTEHLGKKLELDVSVDSSLIGGFLLKLGDQVIDGSLKGKLRAIEKTLLSV
jgi:F-type H+-transporting ATPase subunit delta